ncbi:MAG: peptidylprolyl isomerase [Acidobacteria bacterium]|nr:peptidylprolyl isomerase [Acidobacteriota bacterium]
MRHILSLALISLLTLCAYSQVPIATGIQILKAEDARRYDAVLENLMKSPNAAIRERAALAAGRIGDDNAIPALAVLLDKDPVESVRTMAAFALGEVESVKGADSILRSLSDRKTPNSVRARDVEAAGKIAAANAKDPKAATLGHAILNALSDEDYLKSKLDPSHSRSVVLLGLTAVLRAKPKGGDVTVAKFLTSGDGEVRATAANTLARLRAKNANAPLRKQLSTDVDPIARANAARALGAAEDKDALESLVNAGTKDADLRVRVSAIRSLGSLKDRKATSLLLARGNALLSLTHADSVVPSPGKPGAVKPIPVPLPKNELLEIATTLGQLEKGTLDLSTLKFLNTLRGKMDEPEVNVALARVAPSEYLNDPPPAAGYRDFHVAAAYARGLATIAETKDNALIAHAGERLTAFVAGMATGVRPADQSKMLVAMPELTSATDELKPDNIDEILRDQLDNSDLFIRAAAAGAIADRPKTNDNIAALKSAFTVSFVKDKHDNDAVLAIMDALFKLDKNGSVGSLLVALSSPDYLVRKRAFTLLSDPELQKANPGVATSLENARSKHRDQVFPYSPGSGTKLGQVLNTDADYRRALMRKDGSIRAVLTTEKGSFTIEFSPEEAPLTVDNWVKLARAGYFNGLEVHRVVPNFVIQDGDPRGDGSGGPGYSIRCEINMLPYDRGAVGMALSGKDTGGSQWFVTHSPQPHLDGGYTVFGHVPEKDMSVVDSIVRGDRILRVQIIGR